MPELKKLDVNVETVAPSAKPAPSSAPQQSMTTTPNHNHPFFKYGIFLLAIILGLGTGFAVYKLFPGPTRSGSIANNINSDTVKVGDIIGLNDESAFPDEVEGYLEKGGVDGEGSHHLLRAGGASQTVYLTSSVIDLDALVGNSVRIWGQTFKAQKAGWLMDVGRVEIIQVDAQKPF